MSKVKYAVLNRRNEGSYNFEANLIGIIRETENGKFAFLNDSIDSKIKLDSEICIYDLDSKDNSQPFCIIKFGEELTKIINIKFREVIISPINFVIMHGKEMLIQFDIHDESNNFKDIGFSIDANTQIEIYANEKFIGKLDILDLIFEAIEKVTK